MKHALARVALVVAAILALFGAEPAAAQTVFASNYPLAYFAERITGRPDLVRFPAIDGDPAFWTPTAEDVIAMQGDAVLLFNGAGYETWARYVTLPNSRVVDTTAGFGDRIIALDGEVTHAHGPAGDHAHSGTAFTTWLDLGQAMAQAGAARDALAAAGLVPDAELDRNLAALRADLAALDRTLEEMASRLGGRPLIGSHPVYQYLARRYGLNLKSVHWEPDTAPSSDMWAELEALLQKHPARWMIWEGEPLPETSERLEAIGVRSVLFDPAGNRPKEGDFFSVMKANVAALETVADSKR